MGFDFKGIWNKIATRGKAVNTGTSDVLEAYEKLAASYDALIDVKPHNAYYDRPNTLSLFPEVEGKMILDAGCGPGKYAQILLERGAQVVGFDISPAMVAKAAQRNGSNGTFFVHDLSEPIPIEEDGKFDFVLCALALHYLEDPQPAVKEFYRLLKPGGRLIVSVEHPFFNYLYFKAKNYFLNEKVSSVWRGFGTPIEVPSYRKSLHDTCSHFTESGFLIEKIIEPKPTEEFLKADPKHYHELNAFPSFLCIRAIKA